MMSNKLQMQNLNLDQMYEEAAGTRRQYAPFSRRAALAVENASVNILQLSVKGITLIKLNIIKKLVSKHAVRLILLQENHCTNAAKLVLPNYKLAGFISSRKHGLGHICP